MEKARPSEEDVRIQSLYFGGDEGIGLEKAKRIPYTGGKGTESPVTAGDAEGEIPVLPSAHRNDSGRRDMLPAEGNTCLNEVRLQK